MSSSNGSGGFSKIVFLMVLIPLFVTVVGGLLVELLKPKEVFVGSGSQATPTTSAPNPETASRASAIKKLIVKKWTVANSPSVYGDTVVEFTEHGQLIRTYYRIIVGNEVTHFPYQITPDGEIKTEPLLNLKLVNLTGDELVLSWNGTVVHYKRGWYWWEIALMVCGGVLFVIICAVIKQMGK
jgi:hypothetical protein